MTGALFSRARQRDNGGAGRRFVAPTLDPENAIGLRPDHPALAEARTIFPSTVDPDPPRFLVSGVNNSKLGAKVMKGPWKGRPIYHLALEERATCPRSCAQWSTCYGNSMPAARRSDHRGPEFLELLAAELRMLHRQHRKSGFVVRLHTLGDFYSLDYVRFWADQLDALPGLYVFGYTARRENADDAESRLIAKGLRWLTQQAWDRFALRFSGDPGPQGSIVITRAEEAGPAIVCPAETGRTDACATCGLCWAEAAKGRAIAFLRHGMTRRRHAEGGARQLQRRLERALVNEERAVVRAIEVNAKRPPEPEAPGPYAPVVYTRVWGGWTPRRRTHRIPPAEQDALIREAVAAGRVTYVGGGEAFGARAWWPPKLGVKIWRAL